MFRSVLALVLLGMGAGLALGEGPRIEGQAVNGTQHDKHLVGAEVILRGGEEGALQIVGKTLTDLNGRFTFDKLPTAPGLIFVAGVNHQGIHYPGPRLRLQTETPVLLAKVTAFDTVTAPNPLVADLHDIDIHIKEEVLEVTETLHISNPGLTTYVGHAESGMSPPTLSLLIPDGFERVTFDNEFNGRHFKLRDKRLMTDLPWTPGKREVKFTYHLPFEDGKIPLEWSADLPCTRYRLAIHGPNANRFECNLAGNAKRDQVSVVFESSGPPIPAGQVVRLQPADLPTSWIVYLRWSIVPFLGGLILFTSIFS